MARVFIGTGIAFRAAVRNRANDAGVLATAKRFATWSPLFTIRRRPHKICAHARTFHTFSKLVLFAIPHVVLVLACRALAFLGNAVLIALILGVGGSVALIAAFAFS
jgi:hypothetical protein